MCIFDDPSKAAGCETYVTKFQFISKDNKKYCKYSMLGKYDAEF